MQQCAIMVVAQGGAPERALNGLAAEAATPTPDTRGSYQALVCNIGKLFVLVDPTIAFCIA